MVAPFRLPNLQNGAWILTVPVRYSSSPFLDSSDPIRFMSIVVLKAVGADGCGSRLQQ